VEFAGFTKVARPRWTDHIADHDDLITLNYHFVLTDIDTLNLVNRDKSNSGD
jgi:hypothetical protein